MAPSRPVAPRVRLLMFDLDGTLVDSRADLAAAVNRMRADYGLPPLPPDVVSGYIGEGARVLVERALHPHPVDPHEALARFLAHYRAHLHDQTVLYPDVRAGLEQLRAAGWQLALISNKPEQSCRALLEHFALAGLFASVLGGDSTPHCKPHPEPLLVTLRRLGARAEDAWMIGDHRTDLQAARHAGVRSIFLTGGIGEPGPEQPSQTFGSFVALTKFLLAEG